MICFIFARPAIALFVAAAILALPVRASAEERAHKSGGTASFTSPTTFVGAGLATHLGRYTEAGTVQFSPTDIPFVLHIDACAVYTASNGDRLHARISGQLDLMTGAITASVTYDGGCGRFSDAEGSATLTGQMLQDGSIVVSVEGTIDY